MGKILGKRGFLPYFTSAAAERRAKLYDLEDEFSEPYLKATVTKTTEVSSDRSPNLQFP
jgi:hypothetical protein